MSKQKFFILVPTDTKIDFVGKAYIVMALSALLCVGLVVMMFTKGFNYGIDFTGGTVIHAKFNTPKPIEEVRNTLDKLGQEGASVVSVGEGDTEYLLTVRPTSTTGNISADTPLADKMTAEFGKENFQILKADVVGPKVGNELKGSALRSLIYSVLLIMIYIWFRFDLKFAPGATVAMIHDLIVAAGFFVLTGREFTITSVAALLTIAGYSVNDTIVIYDRVREMFEKAGEDLPLGPTLNKAINFTLSRTVVTAIATFICAVSLIPFTEGELQSFAIAMVIGVIVGSYSTYYIAIPFTIISQKVINRFNAKKA